MANTDMHGYRESNLKPLLRIIYSKDVTLRQILSDECMVSQKTSNQLSNDDYRRLEGFAFQLIVKKSVKEKLNWKWKKQLRLESALGSYLYHNRENGRLDVKGLPISQDNKVLLNNYFSFLKYYFDKSEFHAELIHKILLLQEEKSLAKNVVDKVSPLVKKQKSKLQHDSKILQQSSRPSSETPEYYINRKSYTGENSRIKHVVDHAVQHQSKPSVDFYRGEFSQSAASYPLVLAELDKIKKQTTDSTISFHRLFQLLSGTEDSGLATFVDTYDLKSSFGLFRDLPELHLRELMYQVFEHHPTLCHHTVISWEDRKID